MLLLLFKPFFSFSHLVDGLSCQHIVGPSEKSASLCRNTSGQCCHCIYSIVISRVEDGQSLKLLLSVCRLCIMCLLCLGSGFSKARSNLLQRAGTVRHYSDLYFFFLLYYTKMNGSTTLECVLFCFCVCLPVCYSVITNTSMANISSNVSVQCGSYEQLEYWPNNFNDFAVSINYIYFSFLIIYKALRNDCTLWYILISSKHCILLLRYPWYNESEARVTEIFLSLLTPFFS